MNRRSRLATTVAVTDAPVQRTALPYDRGHRDDTAIATSAPRIVGARVGIPPIPLLGTGRHPARLYYPEEAATKAAHKRRDINMHTKRMLAGALTSVSLAAAGLSLATGTAAADPAGAHTWCPGMSMHSPPGPGWGYAWDMNVCHTWFRVRPGMGNVPYIYLDGDVSLKDSNLWDGPNPPPGSLVECGRDMFTGLPIPC